MPRRGFALIATLAAITMVGALIAGALYAALVRQRASAAELREARALALAEYGIALTIDPAAWDSAWAGAPNGLAGTRAYADGDAVDTVRIARLGTGAFLIASDARIGIGRGGARRRLETFVLLDSAGVPALASAHAWTDVP